jgi:hypothetical protein
MPLPRWLAHINKWVFNPMEVRRSHPRCHRQPAPSARVIVGGMTLPCRGCATDKQLRVSRPAHCHRHERESH